MRHKRGKYTSMAILVLILGLAVSLACSPLPEQRTLTESEEQRIPTAESDPDIILHLSVGVISGRILFQNQSSETLRNILVVMKEEDGKNEFQHTIGTVQPFAMMHFLPRVFTAAGGTKLDPSIHKIKTFTVYADTSSGRGRWRGSY